MLLWIIFAVLTVLAVLILAAPLARRRDGESAEAQLADMAVYKAQLSEIDRDLERGVLDKAEAESARIEVSRRLLAEEARGQGTAAATRTRGALTVLVLSVPVATIGFYLVLGSPDLPGQPIAERLAAQPEDQDLALLVTRVEQHLADNPQDGRGWEVLAPVYRRMGRFDDAARAYAAVIRLLGSTAERESDFGEMLVVAADGIVNADARAAFERSLTLDPRGTKPRYFLALAAEQDGDAKTAIARWTQLLASPEEPQARWRDSARERLVALGGTPPPPPETAPGPDEEQVAAAQDMSAEDRQAMIEGMVAGLAQRLGAEGGSVEEWLRLIRAYGVLNRPDDARAAIAQARAQYADDTAALGRIDAVAQQFDN